MDKCFNNFNCFNKKWGVTLNHRGQSPLIEINHRGLSPLIAFKAISNSHQEFIESSLPLYDVENGTKDVLEDVLENVTKKI